MIKLYLLFFLIIILGCSATTSDVYHIAPIGYIKKSDMLTTIEMDMSYEDGMRGLSEFSHLLVLYWFHKNDSPEMRRILQVHPRGDAQNPLRGVFATRSPVRPNLIGVSICKILSLEKNTIRIDSIDAFDGSPVIDLKPYIPDLDSAVDVRLPDWLD